MNVTWAPVRSLLGFLEQPRRQTSGIHAPVQGWTRLVSEDLFTMEFSPVSRPADIVEFISVPKSCLEAAEET